MVCGLRGVRNADWDDASDLLHLEVHLVSMTSDMFSDLKELRQDKIDQRLDDKIESESAKNFLKACLRINQYERDNVYELLNKEWVFGF